VVVVGPRKTDRRHIVDGRVFVPLVGAVMQPGGGGGGAGVTPSVDVDRRLYGTAEAARDEAGRRRVSGVIERVERDGWHVDVVATGLERV